MEPLIVGIGVGAGTAAIGYFRETAGRAGEVEVAQTQSFRRAIRSALCFDRSSDRWYVGDAAWLKGRQVTNADHFVPSPVPWLSWPGPLAVGTAGAVMDGDHGQPLTGSWLLGQLLRTLVDGLIKQAEDDFCIEEVVLAAPLARADDWRPAVERACGVAGVRLAAVITEPLCILTTYRCEVPEGLPAAGEQVLLVSWGAETLQLTTVRRVDPDLPARFEVVATASAPVGGNAVDRRMLAFLRQRAGDDPARPLPSGPARVALRQRIEEAKISLCNAVEDGAVGGCAYPELIDVPSPDGARHLPIGAGDLSGLLEGPEARGFPALADTLRALCARVRQQGGPVQHVLLAGGSAGLPICRPIVKSVFGADVRFPRLPAECPLDAVVVRGATWQAAAQRGKAAQAPRLDVPPLLGHDMGLRLETSDITQAAPVFAAGMPLAAGRTCRRTIRLRTAVAGPATLRCVGLWRDLPYERLPARERRLIALDLGPLAAGTEVTAEVFIEETGAVSLAAHGPGRRLGPMRGATRNGPRCTLLPNVLGKEAHLG